MSKNVKINIMSKRNKEVLIGKNTTSYLLFYFLYFYFVCSLDSAIAYIGPGMAGGIIAGTIGIIVALVIGLIGILYFPIKRLLRKTTKKTKKK